MTGIIIITAGRDDAFEDYKRSVKEGHSFEELAPYVPEDELASLKETYEGDSAHLWGTSVESKWQKVKPGDIALVYRDGGYIAQARVVHTTTNLELAAAIWDIERNPWNESKPWQHLTFVTDVEDIDVEAEAFNELVDYESTYRPQGFTRVADHRIREIEATKESIETAIADLTGAGIRVHDVDDKEPEDGSADEEPLSDRLIAASEDGKQSEEFEKLVAQAFSRLGCETKWIEGGGDTDVEIISPVHSIVEAKSRSSTRGVDSINATRIDTHRKQRGAEHAIAVSRHFPPGVIDDAESNGITTLTAERLAHFLELRERYGIPPEEVFELLVQPGAFQDDRMDQLAEYVQERSEATKTILDVIEALEHADAEIQSAGDLRLVLIGMNDLDSTPSKSTIQETLQYLTHPCSRIVEHGDDGYRLRTSYQNAVEILESSATLVREVEDQRKDT